MTINFSKNNPYTGFIQISGQSQNGLSPASTISAASVKVSDVPSEKENKNNKKLFGIIGISVGSVALLSLIGLFTLSKGFSSGFSKKVSKWSRNLQNKVYNLSQEPRVEKKISFYQKVKLKFNKAMQRVVNLMQSLSNISAIKDSWARHWLKKIGLEPVIVKLNNAFKGTVTKNTRNYYTKAESANLKLTSFLEETAKQTDDPQIREKLFESAKRMKKLFKDNFSTAEHFERSEKAFKEMYGLDEAVYQKLFADSGILKNMKKYKTYVTTDLISSEKRNLTRKLISGKNALSNNISDNYEKIKQLLGEIEVFVDPKNKHAMNLIKDMNKTMETYKTLSGPQENEMRQKIYEELASKIKNLSAIFKADKQNADKINSINIKINEFNDAISLKSTKKGIAQDALTLIKEQFGKDSVQYKQAKQYVGNLNNSLNNAISSELNSFEKLAELQVGSLPTDILGILAPTALGTFLVVNSKDKHERIGKTFTQGIPILGGVATSYYGMTRGWTGAKNLFLGLGIGYVLNLIGTKTNDLYVKYIEKQSLMKTAYDAWNKLQHKNTTTADK